MSGITQERVEVSAPPVPMGKELGRVLGAEDLQQRTHFSPGCRQTVAFSLMDREDHVRDQGELTHQCSPPVMPCNEFSGKTMLCPEVALPKLRAEH